jgi:hypothetical protein
VKSHICFIFKKIKYSILYLTTVSNGPSCIYEFPFTSQTRTHDFTSLSAGQACSTSSLSAALQSSILCSPLQRQRYSVIAVHKGLFQNARTMHIKKFHIFHSFIYPLPIFICPKSFAGCCNCVQDGMTRII